MFLPATIICISWKCPYFSFLNVSSNLKLFQGGEYGGGLHIPPFYLFLKARLLVDSCNSLEEKLPVRASFSCQLWIQIQMSQLFTSWPHNSMACAECLTNSWGGGWEGGEGKGAGLLLGPQRAKLCMGPDLLPEQAPAARNNSFSEEPLTHASNRTIMVSWLQSCPFEM